MLKLFKSSAVVLLGLSLFMVGCISGTLKDPLPGVYWKKYGKSYKDSAHAKGECVSETGAYGLPKEKAMKLVGYCMKAKGYKLKKGRR